MTVAIQQRNTHTIAAGAEQFVFALCLGFVFTIPFENLFIIPGLGTLARVVGALLSGSWIVVSLAQRSYRRMSSVHAALYAFITWAMLTTLWTRAAGFSMIRMTTLIQLLLLVFIVWNVLEDRERLRAGLQAYVLGCYVTFAALAINYLSGNVSQWQRRASIANSDENDVGLVLALMLPIAWHLATTTNFGWARVVNYLAIPVGYLGIFLTVSRGSLLATAPFLFYVVFSYRSLPPKQKPLVGAGCLAAIAALGALIPASSWVRILEIGEQVQERNLSSRYTIWTLGFQEWLSTPINMMIGIGVGAHPFVIGKVAHNTALEILVELGLIGLGLYVLAAGTVLRLLLRAPLRVRFLWFAALSTLLIGTTSLSWQFEKPLWLMIGFAITHASTIYIPSRGERA